MGMTMAKKTGRNDGWDLDEAPAAQVKVPSTGRAQAVKTALWVVLISGILSPLLLIASIGTIKDALSTKTAAGANTAAVSSPGRLAATVAVTKWLTTVPAPVVDGQVISWDGSTIIPTTVTLDRSGKTTSPVVNFISEIDSFSVVDGYGQQYNASVQVLIDPRTKTGVAIGSPSLLPVVTKAGDGWQTGGPWPGLATASIPDPVVKATSGWASAYTSGDGSTLRIAVGDPEQTHMYTPLSGVDQVTSSVMLGAVPAGDPSAMIIQVKLILHWVSQPVLSPAEQMNKDRPGILLDLLVERANTAAPVITAWGAPGSGTTLARYGNAANGEGRTQSTTAPTITASPSSTPSPSVSRS